MYGPPTSAICMKQGSYECWWCSENAAKLVQWVFGVPLNADDQPKWIVSHPMPCTRKGLYLTGQAVYCSPQEPFTTGFSSFEDRVWTYKPVSPCGISILPHRSIGHRTPTPGDGEEKYGHHSDSSTAAENTTARPCRLTQCIV